MLMQIKEALYVLLMIIFMIQGEIICGIQIVSQRLMNSVNKNLNDI